MAAPAEELTDMEPDLTDIRLRLPVVLATVGIDASSSEEIYMFKVSKLSLLAFHDGDHLSLANPRSWTCEEPHLSRHPQWNQLTRRQYYFHPLIFHCVRSCQIDC
jgi:hypothetical protein